MHKLLLAREKKNMSKLFHVSMRNTKENENMSVLDKVSRGEIRGISSAIFFFSPEERRTVKDGVSLLERRFTLSRIMKKKRRRRRKLGGFHFKWRGKKKEQTIIKARGVPAMIFIALCSYSAWGGEEEKWIKPWISIPLLIGTEVGFYLLKNNIPETYFGKEEEVWLGWRL